MSAERTPIEFRDIRAGDLIRSETTDDVALGDNLLATEWRADAETKYRAPASGVAFFLLDRPEQPLLDDEWRLGWIHCENPENTLGFWRMPDAGVEGRDDLGRTRIPRRPTGFTPATAVPTDALDELRRRRRAGQFNCLSGQPVLDFLDAVDKAGQP
jgi:hypothetical protein